MRINLGIRRRLAPLLGNDRRKIELLNALLFSLPGTPVSTTATRSAWATTSTSATATACARRCSGRRRPQRRLLDGQPAPALPALITEPEYHYESVNVELVNVDYVEGASDLYMLPMAYAGGPRAEQLLTDWRHLVIARLQLDNAEEPGVIYDPLLDRDFCRALLSVISNRKKLRNETAGEIAGVQTKALRGLLSSTDQLEPQLVRAEQSNTSIIFGQSLIMKLFRKVDVGMNPDLEIGRFLTDVQRFPNTPPVAGQLEYLQGRGEPRTLAILQGFVENEGDAWDYTLDVLRGFFDDVLANSDLEAPSVLPATIANLLSHLDTEPPDVANDLMAPYLESARVLGQRTAEMHLALSAGEAEAFRPEPFSTLYQRSLYQSMRSLATQTLQSLRKLRNGLPADMQALADEVLAREDTLLARFQRITAAKMETVRTRIHGDFHLGQVLFTGKDFMIIDFEGEPVRPITERKIKRSPLRDVAGMLRSFQYAAYSSLFSRTSGMSLTQEEIAILQRWADFWCFWASNAYLARYYEIAQGAIFLPPSQEDVAVLLEHYLLEKVIYEVGYEMNNRPTWLSIPLNGILSQIDT
jgi:maltose alpha-D-glucosyltransferase/alpha-amylase